MDRNSPTRRTVVGAIGAGVASSAIVGTVSADEHAVEMTFEDQQVRGGGACHERQRVVIDHVYIPEPGGWVDLHHSERNEVHEQWYFNENAEPARAGLGRPFGISDFLEGGEDHYDVEVPLFVDEGIPCLNFRQTRMEESHWLMAMGHKNSGTMPGSDGDEPEYVHFCWMQADEREDYDREDFGGGDLSFSDADEVVDAFIEVPPDDHGDQSDEADDR